MKKRKKKINLIFETLYAGRQFIDIASPKYLDLKTDLYSIFLNGKIKEYCLKGFTNYTFLNTKKDYDLVKKLLLLFFYYSYDSIKMRFEVLMTFMKCLFKEIKNGDYLEKIQVLLYLFGAINSGKNLSNNYIIDVFDKNQVEYDLYKKPSSEAFNLFFEIMDNQKEECPFFQTIQQFNWLIKTDLIRNIDMYSGAICSLNDIKIELYKKINRFLFINDFLRENDEVNGEFHLHSKILVFYPKSSFNIQNYYRNKDSYKNLDKRLQAAFLFLIFHEVCGHLKTHINNNVLSPRHYFNNNITLILSTFIKSDSGFIFENILTNNCIDLRCLIGWKFQRFIKCEILHTKQF